MKHVYSTAAFCRYSFYGEPIATMRVELYMDEDLPQEVVEIAKENARRHVINEAKKLVALSIDEFSAAWERKK